MVCSHDLSIGRKTISIFSLEKSRKFSDQEREELLGQIDFSRVNEETIAACKSNKLIPQQLITDAALSLCAKLRGELDEAQARLRLAEGELAKSRPSYTGSSNIISFSLIDIRIDSCHSYLRLSNSSL